MKYAGGKFLRSNLQYSSGNEWPAVKNLFNAESPHPHSSRTQNMSYLFHRANNSVTFRPKLDLVFRTRQSTDPLYRYAYVFLIKRPSNEWSMASVEGETTLTFSPFSSLFLLAFSLLSTTKKSLCVSPRTSLLHPKFLSAKLLYGFLWFF